MRLPILTAALTLSLAGASAGAEADWELTLRKQMEDEHRCKTDYLSHIVERQIGDRFLLSAKVHCKDKRTFDANWDQQARRFEIRRCGDVETC
ncbi:MAG TPA: hypothetical protein VF274_09845 [Alphaproteobacteria bacterium]|jgi:hypothetical protein